MLGALTPAEVASVPAAPPGSQPEQRQDPFPHLPLLSQGLEGVADVRTGGLCPIRVTVNRKLQGFPMFLFALVAL